MYYVLLESRTLSDLPVTLDRHLEWASSYNYTVVVEQGKVSTYNKFTNKLDAKRYAYSHDQPMLKLVESDVPEYPLLENSYGD
jgi:hypothetical protein